MADPEWDVEAVIPVLSKQYGSMAPNDMEESVACARYVIIFFFSLAMKRPHK